MAACLLALGANLGDAERAVHEALEAIDLLPELTLVRYGTTHRTQPVGGPAGQADFANAVAIAETSLAPQALLEQLHGIEASFDRTREQRWGPRTLDLDLLLVEQLVVDTPLLTVPHPRMSFRPFVLDPAVEIADDWRHPLLDATLGELHHQLHHGDDAVLLYGGTSEQRRWHANQLAPLLDGWKIVEQQDALVVPANTADSPSPKLAIALHNAGEPLRPGVPTLTIPADSGQQVLFEITAAVACVWPDLCRGAGGG